MASIPYQFATPATQPTQPQQQNPVTPQVQQQIIQMNDTTALKTYTELSYQQEAAAHAYGRLFQQGKYLQPQEREPLKVKMHELDKAFERLATINAAIEKAHPNAFTVGSNPSFG